MRIFGRKRSTGSGITASSEAPAAVAAGAIAATPGDAGASAAGGPSAADAAAARILREKPDPARRNARERRLVKRYLERHPGVAAPKATEATAPDAPRPEPDKSPDLPEPETEPERTDEASDINLEARDGQPTTADLPHEVADLLRRLPSKARRRLARAWERGDMAAEQLAEEARTLLGGTGTTYDKEVGEEKVSEKLEAAPAAESTSVSKKRRRRRSGAGDVDESKLAPEERLRREEQRRLQLEARERRQQEGTAEEGSTPKRHPLNSERRRANRRKPKWPRKETGGSNDGTLCNSGGKSAPSSYKAEHAASGYLIRKRQRAE